MKDLETKSRVERNAAPREAPRWQGPVLAVCGPTAGGKSALAMALAERVGGEIVNTDSMQVYRHFDIGTAKPSAEERARIPHHLVDRVEPDEPYSAGQYVSDALAAIHDIAGRCRVPVLCGGSGLYFRALLFGLADIPDIPAAIRAEVEGRLEIEGPQALHAALTREDPETAAGIHPNDPARIARALEVLRATGTPLSRYRRARPFQAPVEPVLMLGLHWERARLYERINQRVTEMLAAGWVEEVREMLARGYPPTLKPMQAIGYKNIVLHLQGHEPEEGLEARIALRTRQYAKRQTTWFRKQSGIRWREADDLEGFLADADAFLSGQPFAEPADSAP